MNLEIDSLLPVYLQSAFPERQGIQIEHIEDLTTGWESTIYALNLTFQKDGQRMQDEIVLRIYPGDYAAEKSRHEFQGMQLLHQAGYPVPRVHLIEENPTSIGKAFMLLDRIQGEVMWSLIDRSSQQQQRELLTQFCDLFLRLHRLDWRPFVESSIEIEKGGKYLFIDGWIDESKTLLEEYGKQEFLPVIGWLEQHRDEIPAKKPSVVHRDFHPANLLVTPAGSVVVIDWTGWRVSDYHFDLAWTLLLARVYGGEEMRRSILSGYEKAAGETVENLEYFEVCACARRLFDVTTSLALGAERLGMRPEAVETMRSQVGHLSMVYDILRDHTRLRIPYIEQLLRRNLQGEEAD
jgi:aminoglycoside phosphotransferase (APT) family kinase protein